MLNKSLEFLLLWLKVQIGSRGRLLLYHLPTVSLRASHQPRSCMTLFSRHRPMCQHSVYHRKEHCIFRRFSKLGFSQWACRAQRSKMLLPRVGPLYEKGHCFSRNLYIHGKMFLKPALSTTLIACLVKSLSFWSTRKIMQQRNKQSRQCIKNLC